ncbi:aliphatic sulfonate ABC transporter substrate-binding protein [Roseomonas elaeocarpi]|uniref:Aliphatic sulfonate ABC transporter substrate-binding protein n=1 Tax=Roseomonas elaeocarpi TaxID=907779 RepID=A0ABV6JUJ9_9PROT
MNQTPPGSARRSFLLASAGLLSAAALARPHLARAAAPPLRVANQKGGLRSLLEASGEAAKLSFPIEWSEFPAAAPLLEALSAEAVDVGTMGDLAFLGVFASGAPVRAYAATRADPRSQAILVRGDSAARGLADLRGRKVAANRGGWGQFLLLAAAERAGLPLDAVEPAALGPAEAALAFRSGSVDGWAIWEPYVSIEVAQFGARVIEDGTGITPTVSFLAAHQRPLRERRDQLAELLRAQQAGWRWAAGNVDAYAAANARLTRLPEAPVQAAFRRQATRAIPIDAAVVAELQAAADRAARYGVIRQRIAVADALDTGFSLAAG